jgi:hypothetical protein
MLKLRYSPVLQVYHQPGIVNIKERGKRKEERGKRKEERGKRKEERGATEKVREASLAA